MCGKKCETTRSCRFYASFEHTGYNNSKLKCAVFPTFLLFEFWFHNVNKYVSSETHTHVANCMCKPVEPQRFDATSNGFVCEQLAGIHTKEGHTRHAAQKDDAEGFSFFSI